MELRGALDFSSPPVESTSSSTTTADTAPQISSEGQSSLSNGTHQLSGVLRDPVADAVPKEEATAAKHSSVAASLIPLGALSSFPLPLSINQMASHPMMPLSIATGAKKQGESDEYVPSPKQEHHAPAPPVGAARGSSPTTNAPSRSRVTCKVCKRSFGRQADLNRHTRHVHRRVRHFRCAICFHEFAERGHFTSHVASVHRREYHLIGGLEGPPKRLLASLASHSRIAQNGSWASDLADVTAALASIMHTPDLPSLASMLQSSSPHPFADVTDVGGKQSPTTAAAAFAAEKASHVGKLASKGRHDRPVAATSTVSASAAPASAVMPPALDLKRTPEPASIAMLLQHDVVSTGQHTPPLPMPVPMQQMPMQQMPMQQMPMQQMPMQQMPMQQMPMMMQQVIMQPVLQQVALPDGRVVMVQTQVPMIVSHPQQAQQHPGMVMLQQAQSQAAAMMHPHPMHPAEPSIVIDAWGRQVSMPPGSIHAPSHATTTPPVDMHMSRVDVEAASAPATTAESVKAGTGQMPAQTRTRKTSSLDMLAQSASLVEARLPVSGHMQAPITSALSHAPIGLPVGAVPAHGASAMGAFVPGIPASALTGVLHAASGGNSCTPHITTTAASSSSSSGHITDNTVSLDSAAVHHRAR